MSYRTLIACAFLGLVGCHLQVNMPPKIAGSGKVSKVDRAVDEFTRINVSGSAEVVVDVGEETKVTVEIDDNLQSIVETNVRGNTLTISTTQSYQSDSGLKVRVTTPKLEEVQASGAVRITANDVDAEHFKLDVSGACKCVLTGKVGDLALSLSGAGKVDASKLEASTADASISGAGHAQVHATESLEASVSGAGSLRYSGSPKDVHRRISGAGSVRPSD